MNGAAPETCVVEVDRVGTRIGGLVIHDNLSFCAHRGEVLALVGGSGSGKTTLLRHIAGLSRPAAGEVRLFGQSLRTADAVTLRDLRRRFGMLFQHGALFSALTAFDNVAFPLRELRLVDEGTIRDLVMLKLAMVGIAPQEAHLLPAQLSGGMVKRVALARALALEPELLLLDEPTAGLDPDRSASFVRLVRDLDAELGLSVILVTHDLDTLAALATRVAVLADKRIVACAPLDEVRESDHPFARSFFGKDLR